MCFGLFFLATFLTQITALNMIIAIMGDTFSKLSETRSQHKRQTQIALLAEYIDHIKDDEKEKPSQFLVVVECTAETLQNGEWEGSLKSMQSYMKETSDDLRDDVDERTKMLKDLIIDQKNRSAIQEKETQSKINEISSILKTLNDKINTMESKMSDQGLGVTKNQVSNMEKKLDEVLSRLDKKEPRKN